MKMHKYVCKIYISAWVFCTWSIILQWPLVVIRGETSLSQYQRLMKRLFFAAHFVKWVTPTALLFKQRAEAYVTPQQSRWPWRRWACCSHPTDSHQNLSQVHRPLPSRSVSPCSHTNHHPPFIHQHAAGPEHNLETCIPSPEWSDQQWCRRKWEFCYRFCLHREVKGQVTVGTHSLRAHYGDYASER